MINNDCIKPIKEIFICLLILIFGFFFNILYVNAETIEEAQQYSDKCFTQFITPYYFDYDPTILEDTPFYFIVENLSSNNTNQVNYSLYAFNTNNIYFDLTGGTWYAQTKNDTDTFTVAMYSCSTERATSVQDNVQLPITDNQVINYIDWTFNWKVNRDFNNTSWNRNIFRKWNDNTLTELSYTDMFFGFNYQLSGGSSNYGYIVSSNFDLYNSNDELVFKNSIREPEPEPVPPTSEDLLTDIKNDLFNSNIEPFSMPNFVIDTGAVSSLLTMPIRYLQYVINSLQVGTCMPFYLGNLLGTDLYLPCIDVRSILGDFIYDLIDIILCGAFAWTFRDKLIRIWNSLINLEYHQIGAVDDIDELPNERG